MAITFIGSASAEGVNGTVTVTLPGGVQADDYVVAATQHSVDADVDHTESSGTWTELADLYADDTQDPQLAVYAKRMTGTPDTSVVFNANSGVGRMVGALMVFRGVDTTTPLDVTPTTGVSSNSQNPDPPSITPSTDGAEIVIVGSSSEGTGTATFPTGYTANTVEVVHTADSSARVLMASKNLGTAAPENPAAWSISAGGGADGWCAVTLALRPAGAGSGPITGTLSVTLGALTSVGSSKLTLRGLVTKALGGLTSVGTSIVKLGGQVNRTLGGLTSAALSKLGLKAQTSVTLGALTIVATGVHGPIEEPDYDPEDDLPRWQMRNATNRRIRRI